MRNKCLLLKPPQAVIFWHDSPGRRTEHSFLLTAVHRGGPVYESECPQPPQETRSHTRSPPEPPVPSDHSQGDFPDKAADTTSCRGRRGRGEGGQRWYQHLQVAMVTQGRPLLLGGKRAKKGPGPRATPRTESSRRNQKRQTDPAELYFGGEPERGKRYLKHRAAAWRRRRAHTQAARLQAYFNKMA